MTGHDDGIVTIALAEADSAEIEKRRSEMAETLSELLGHFRHEVGHHYWDILVRDGGRLDACRAVFGDDTQDYEAALKRHYEQGAPPDWQERFVSAYATSHPWEDFAETWAHYLHIVDTLETASAFGLRIDPSIDREGAHKARLDFDPYVEGTIDEIIEAWAPFVVAMNSVNRAMGRPTSTRSCSRPPWSTSCASSTTSCGRRERTARPRKGIRGWRAGRSAVTSKSA